MAELSPESVAKWAALTPEQRRELLRELFAEMKPMWEGRMGVMREPTPAEIQAGIDRTMIEVIRRDAAHNPNALVPPVNNPPAGAGVAQDTSRNGWQDFRPLKVDPEVAVVDRMVGRMQPHSRENPMQKEFEGKERAG
jgi:hypothetical protein